MTTLAALTETDVLELSERLGEPDWLRDRRLEAFKAFLDLPWPASRDEAWRYTDPQRFDLQRPVLQQPGLRPSGETRLVAAVDELAGRATIVDGGVTTVTVCAEAQARGVVVADLGQAAREHPDLVRGALGAAAGHDEKFDAASLAAWTAGVAVIVPAEVELAEPIAITLRADSAGTLLPRVLVVAGAHAKATVYVDRAGDGAATVVEVTEVVSGEGSSVVVVHGQSWGSSVDHVGTHRALVGDNAEVRSLEVTLGGRTVYVRPDVLLRAQGGRGELLGVYSTSDGQRVEHRSLIHHDASRTSSELVYKGALQGDSRATFFGNIRIEPHAKATSSDQTNRNLILGQGARADSIPFLEIECSDVVRCGHHSSVGQVDERQLFYLQARGITRDEAIRMLVLGFFTEVTARIAVPGVTDVIVEEVERQLASGQVVVAAPTGAGAAA